MYSYGYVGIVGRPNAGKSTLVNALVGEKVAIVSSKPQTTRDNIIGIKTGKDYQVVLVDTPGIHKTKTHLDKFMMKNVRSALAGVDVIVYLVDGSKPVSEEEKENIAKLKSEETPVIIVSTKADKQNKAEIQADYEISSITGKNIDALFNAIIKLLPKSKQKNFIYEEDEYTDKSVKFLIAEDIREHALKNLDKEIPHGIAVEITRFERKHNCFAIDADIICEKDSHKGIIIGKGGQNLKKIGEGARLEAEKLLSCKVMLKLFVKVEEGWRDKPNKIISFGYVEN